MTRFVCDTSHKPTISVVTATYNRARLLPRMIDSVLNQTYEAFELIIVDDGSTDQTKEVVQDYQDDRIKFICQANAGANAARNAGIAASQGDWIIVLDSDDEALSDWLENIAAVATIEEQAGIISCGAIWIYQNSNRTSETAALPYNKGAIYDNQSFLFLSGTYAVRRRIYQEIGGFAPECRSGQSTELALRLVPHCLRNGWELHCIQKPLVKLYDHGGAKIRRNYEARLKGVSYILQHHSARLRRVPKVYSLYCASAGVSCARLNRYQDARAFFLASIQSYPLNWRSYGRLFFSLLPPIGRKLWSLESNTSIT